MDRAGDRILINGLGFRCVIGVSEPERMAKQDILVDIALWTDLRRAGSSDLLEDTIDYKGLRDSIMAMAEGSRYRLIESLAHKIADICLDQPLVKKVKVRVRKPAALRFAQSVAVELVRRRPVLAMVAVGSNIDPHGHIPAALSMLKLDVQVLASSTFYRTEALGQHGTQPAFVNGAWMIRTDMTAWQVKHDLLRRAEIALGRQRTADKYAPRPIDLDLVLYEDMVSSSAVLPLPHPDLARPFVLGPVMELIDLEPGLCSQISRLVPKSRPQVAGTPDKQLTAQLRQLLQPQP